MELNDLKPFALVLLGLISIRIVWYFVVLYWQANDDYEKD